ncbi:hypothetical protein [Tenacibaculum sp. UWU-22]|uniref:hypothetical protein n=1 Tax=Tenacibaculum sp. UWU-22 TaxID=3234187 RepID=UPI0034DAD974
MIAFLHTSEIHIQRFEKLVRKYDKNVTVKHFVNEKLLETALLSGKADSELFKNEIENIKKKNPSLLICTCSTYGEECDNHTTVYRIDKPVIEYMVQNYTKIGLAFTAHSTKKVSENLILKVASELNKQIEILNCDCSEFWTYFENKDIEKYEKGIAKSIEQIASKVEVVFLAQASMEGAKTYLTDLKKEVLSSPEFGIKKLLKKCI